MDGRVDPPSIPTGIVRAGGRPYSARPAKIGQWANQAGDIHRILEYLGEPAHPPRIAPAARGPRRGEGDFDTREGETFALSEPLPEYELDPGGCTNGHVRCHCQRWQPHATVNTNSLPGRARP
jgi:hypothetical protein